MTSKPLFTVSSPSNRVNRLAYAVMAIVLVAWSILSYKGATKPPYVDLALISFGIITGGLAVICLIKAIRPTLYSFSNSGIVKSNWKGDKSIPKAEILGCRISNYDKRKGGRIIFKTLTGYLTIHSYAIEKYKRVASYAKRRYPHLASNQMRWYTYRYWWLLYVVLFGISILSFSNGLYMVNRAAVPLELSEVEVELTETPTERIRTSGRRLKRSYPYCRIQVKEYPEFRFEVRDKSYNRLSKSIYDELNAGDKIVLGLRTAVLNSKLLSITDPPFWMRHINWYRIDVYEIRQGEKSYLDYEFIAEVSNNRRKQDGLWLMIIGSVLIAVVLYPGIRSKIVTV